MNKRMINFTITAALIVPSLLCAFEHKQDGITLKITDYARETTSVLGYTPDGALTAEKFLTKSIHPVRITIKNDTDKPIMISGRSMRLKCIDQQTLVNIFQKDNLLTTSVGWDHVLAGALLMVSLRLLTESAWPITCTIGTFWSYKSMISKHEILGKTLKDLTAQEELRYPEVIQPGKKISKLLLIDERMNKKRMIEFVVFEKNEEIITKFEIKLT